MCVCVCKKWTKRVILFTQPRAGYDTRSIF